MSNPRGQHRRLHVPKAGDLYVNGTKTAKGNVHQATKKVISRTDRRKVEAGEKAPIRVGTAGEYGLAGDDCAHCDEPLRPTTKIRYYVDRHIGVHFDLERGCHLAYTD